MTAPLPDRPGTSHPGFDVGGHMTPNENGRVPTGGVCYLMPLCKWHNSTRRDGTPFEHDETKMLQLTGYMEGDIAMTFAARSAGGEPYRLVSLEGDAPTARGMEAPRLDLFNALPAGPALPSNYVLFRREEAEGEEQFVIEDARFQERY
ncbi:MAG: hypothetical protein AAF546_10855 [Verrucomicrobiota bacterium]